MGRIFYNSEENNNRKAFLKALLSVPAHPCFRKELNMKILDVDEFNKIVGKSLEECREKISDSFYRGAKLMIDKVNEMAEETDDE